MNTEPEINNVSLEPDEAPKPGETSDGRLSLINLWNNLAHAFSFLTVIPVPAFKSSSDNLSGSLIFFPVVGTFLGIVLLVLNNIFIYLFPYIVANTLLIVSSLLLTGGLHIDGFADCCDGLFKYGNPEKRLEIMRDSRIGAYGAAGIMVILLLRFAALQSLPQDFRFAALLCAPILSRWAMAYAVVFWKYARQEGLGKAFQKSTPLIGVITSLVTAGLLLAAIIFSISNAALEQAVIFLACVSISLFVVNIAAGYCVRKLGGLTGDCYGFINEIIECSILLFFTVPYMSFIIQLQH